MVDIQKLVNPFPGLRPFEPSENHLFFGRDDQSHELLRKLRRNRFVAVVGTSGSGKSSLVRAGLLPALHGGFMAQAGSSWRIALLRPGHDPIGNLARALYALEVFGESRVEMMDQATIIEVTLRRGDLGLVEATRQARLGSHENLLIVVDQFEELFRFKQILESEQESDEAAAFVSLLLEAMKSKTESIFIVLTMRSDFLGDCSQFRDLPEAMNEGQYLVPRMTRNQRDLAITGPVAVGGGKITQRLVQQLLNDVGDNPDQLPIMQHALMRTWEFWELHRTNGNPIDFEHYEGIGGMNEALSFHADEAYKELPDAQSQKIAEILFKTLSERGPDNREIRRPTKLGQICAIAKASEKEVLAVIDTFRSQGRSFLMPPPGMALAKETLIDVSHESLIRNWNLLKKWVDEESQSAQIYSRLAETAVLYRDDKAGFWRDPDLQIALNWREQVKPNASWGQVYHPEFDSAMEFLDKSKANRDAEMSDIEAARQRELQQAQELAKEQSKAAKHLRIALTLVSVVLVAGVLAVVAFMQRRTALKTAQDAERDRISADSRADESTALFNEADSLRNIAILAAGAERSARVETEQQRTLAIMARDSAAIERERAETQALAATQSENVAITARDNALNSQRQVQAVALAINSRRLLQQGEATLGALLALESYRFDELSGRQFRNEVYDALRRSLNGLVTNRGGPYVLPAPTSLITSMDFSSVSQLIAVGGGDGTIQMLELSQPDQPRLLGEHQGTVTAAAFSPNGTTLASGGADFLVRIWDLRDDSQSPTVLRGHENRIWCIAFDPNGEGLASGSIDGIVRYWDLQNGNVSGVLGQHSGNVLSMAFNKTGTMLASGGADKRVLLWNLKDNTSPMVQDTLHFASAPRALAFSPLDDFLAVGCEDGTTQLKWLERGQDQTLRGHQKRVTSVAFNPAGNLLASGSSDKTIRLWNLQKLNIDPIVLSEHESSIRSIAFTAKGDTLIAGTFGKNIVLWLTSTSALSEMVRSQMNRNLTPEEWLEFVGEGSEYPYRK